MLGRREYNKMSSILSSIQLFCLYPMVFYFIYIYTRRVAVLMFLEIAVSRVPVSVSPYPSCRISAS
jgi:hypothetical protein